MLRQIYGLSKKKQAKYSFTNLAKIYTDKASSNFFKTV